MGQQNEITTSDYYHITVIITWLNTNNCTLLVDNINILQLLDINTIIDNTMTSRSEFLKLSFDDLDQIQSADRW